MNLQKVSQRNKIDLDGVLSVWRSNDFTFVQFRDTSSPAISIPNQEIPSHSPIYISEDMSL